MRLKRYKLVGILRKVAESQGDLLINLYLCSLWESRGQSLAQALRHTVGKEMSTFLKNSVVASLGRPGKPWEIVLPKSMICTQ